MIDRRNLFDQPVKKSQRTYDNIQKIQQVIEMITQPVLYLRKQQALDADPKAIQQIDFTGNLDRAGITKIYFIVEEAKETILDFLQGTVKVF